MSYTTSSWLREMAWRAGRKLYCCARKEPPNNPVNNGEYWLFNQYVNTVPHVYAIMDIGANVGEWTQNCINTLHEAGKSASIHAFEPTRAAYDCLSNKFHEDDGIRLIKAAVTHCSGNIDMFVVTPCAGTNSRHPEPGAESESVNSISVDDYCITNSIQRLGFVKSDVEGFDLDVLKGANEILKDGRCDVWQFEYNYRWVYNRSFIKDVFEFIEDKPYRFGKLYGNGIDFYDRWHPEMERYFECNCVLIKKGSLIESLGRQVRFTLSNAVRYE